MGKRRAKRSDVRCEINFTILYSYFVSETLSVRLDQSVGLMKISRMSVSAKKAPTTKGTKLAAAARKECNKLSDESRIHLTATAMRLIYHNQAGATKAVAHRG